MIAVLTHNQVLGEIQHSIHAAVQLQPVTAEKGERLWFEAWPNNVRRYVEEEQNQVKRSHQILDFREMKMIIK